jgi:hypothetical protein
MIRQAARHANNRQSGELVVSGVGRGGPEGRGYATV